MTGATLSEIEELFAETIKKVANMDGMMQTLMATQATIAKAHGDVGIALTMMAKTFEKTEERQNQLENTNVELYKEKGIPPKIFLLVTSTFAIMLILGAVWVTDTFIKASFTTFEAGRKEDTKKIESSINKAKTEAVEKLKDGN